MASRVCDDLKLLFLLSTVLFSLSPYYLFLFHILLLYILCLFLFSNFSILSFFSISHLSLQLFFFAVYLSFFSFAFSFFIFYLSFFPSFLHLRLDLFSPSFSAVSLFSVFCPSSTFLPHVLVFIIIRCHLFSLLCLLLLFLFSPFHLLYFSPFLLIRNFPHYLSRCIHIFFRFFPFLCYHIFVLSILTRTIVRSGSGRGIPVVNYQLLSTKKRWTFQIVVFCF